MERLRCGGTAVFDAESGISYRCTECLAVIGSIGQPERCKRINSAEPVHFRGVAAWLSRDAPYPSGARPGRWDIIEFSASSSEDAQRFVRACEAKFWRPWIVGQDSDTGEPAGLLYKPAGARGPWTDD
jgi:hypothetical protein